MPSYIQSLCVGRPKKNEIMIQTKDHFQKITKIFADENFPFYSHIGGKCSICFESLLLLIYYENNG